MRKLIFALLLLAAPLAYPARTGNGTTGYLVSNTTMSEFNVTTAYSYSFHYKGVAAVSGLNRRTVQFQDGASFNMSFGFAYDSSTAAFQKMAFQITDAGTKVAQLTSSPGAGEWHWYGATWDGSNLKAYYDGALEATTAATTLTRSDLHPKLTLLALITPDQFDDGTIEEFVAWPTVALSATQIKSIHNGAHPYSALKGKPVVYFRLRGAVDPEPSEAHNATDYTMGVNGTVTQTKHSATTRLLFEGLR